ncbi:hypothetical protein ACFP2T_39075 [Plantactinospora solaniradicis]|uniref:CdiI immunity protein domain-containing protein n=1 Tax=Plantactinospora solaniradicis TaxID=1723736 RepID=A0ABW1KK29_9ACTN
MALEEAADLLSEHGLAQWATFLQGVIDHAEDERALDRLRQAFDELADLVLNPGAADDADFVFQQRLGQAWVNLERLTATE